MPTPIDKIKETDIQHSICEYLALRGHFFFRTNNMPVFDHVRKSFRAMPKYSMKGVPDIIVLHRGAFYGLEVKKPKGKQSIWQKDFENKCKSVGGNYHVVTTIEQVKAIGL